jgi:hypothetical protein
MAEETTDTTKPRRTFDSAYGFSFSIAVGLVLFITGLIISLTVGQGTSIGLIFGVPLLVAGFGAWRYAMFIRRRTMTNNFEAPHIPVIEQVLSHIPEPKAATETAAKVPTAAPALPPPAAASAAEASSVSS